MDLSSIFERAKDFQAQLENEQKKLQEKRFEGFSGGGVVKVVIDGMCNIKSVIIDEKFLSPDNQEVISDLIIAAFNSARKELEVFASENFTSIFPKV